MECNFINEELEKTPTKLKCDVTKRQQCNGSVLCLPQEFEMNAFDFRPRETKICLQWQEV